MVKHMVPVRYHMFYHAFWDVFFQSFSPLPLLHFLLNFFQKSIDKPSKVVYINISNNYYY